MGSLLLLWCLATILIVLAGRSGIASALLVDVIIWAKRWVTASTLVPAAIIVLATAYLFWSGLAERVLTLRYACGALAISAAFGAAWLTVLQTAGVQLVTLPAANAVPMLSLLLLPLMASALVPWSLSRIRHI